MKKITRRKNNSLCFFAPFLAQQIRNIALNFVDNIESVDQFLRSWVEIVY